MKTNAPKLIALSRRKFLVNAAIASTVAALPKNIIAAPPPNIDEWFDRPMCWAQLTLVENDPGNYDPKFWLDYFKRIHADAACLSAGGAVAYYPTKIPMHYRSAWMKDSDPFGELFAGCRKQNMTVLARTDPHAVHQYIYDAHPDWIAVDAEGKKRRHWAAPELWVTCALGPYNFEYMTEVHKEIMTMYKPDGIFSNRWAGSGMCYCEHCQRNFKAAYNMDLPRTNDPQNLVQRNYIQWKQQRLFAVWKLWDSEIRKINPQARYIANSGGGALSSLDMKTIGEISATLFSDKQARRGLTTPLQNGRNGKEYRATMGRKAIGGIFSVGVEEPYRWKDSVQSEAEIRMWVAEGTANGLRPWFTKFSGTLYDKRWLKVVEDIYNWHYKAEKYLRNETPLARVAMVYSQQTATFYGGSRAQAKVEDHTEGFYHALVEARIPFEMVHDQLLDAAHVDQFKVLILPNIAALSEGQCNQLREFVKRGGSIVATHETSLYDEWGARRKDFGLADLFGATFKGRLESPMQNSYLQLEKDSSGKFHPILAGLEDAGRIINGVSRVDVEATEKSAMPLTVIPSYPDLPMELVYPRVKNSGIAGVHLHEIGKARVVYFPWDIDRTFWEVMSPAHGKLLSNAVRWALNEEPFVTVAGAGMIDVTVWRQRDSMTVHLVNLTNPMLMKGPIRELIPISEQKVRVRLPHDKKVGKVQLLVSGTAIRAEVSGEYLLVTVPSILAHEVVAIDLK